MGTVIANKIKSLIFNRLKKINFLYSKYMILSNRMYHNFEFHGDKIFKRAFKKIGSDIRVTAVVETGTFLGFTTKLFARLFPDVQIYTCEINRDYFRKAKKSLLKYPNVHVYNMNSSDFLNFLISENKLGEQPMFYLDAHWLDKWPLEQEIEIISEQLKNAVVLIDDFKIPGNPNFVYDRYKDKECSLDRINPNIHQKNIYNLLMPNYGHEDAFSNVKKHEKFLVGYPIIFINYRDYFKKLLSDEFFNRYFKDESKLIKVEKFYS